MEFPKSWLWISVCISQLLFLCLLPFLFRLIVFVHPLAAIVLWSIVTFGLLFGARILYSILHRQPITIKYTMIRNALVLYGICLLILLFFRPFGQIYTQYNLIPFQTILFYIRGDVELSVAVYNLAGNVGLFVPFGFFLSIHMCYFQVEGRKRVPYMLIPVVSILGIEVLQYLTHRGMLDIDDFLFNLFGIAIGVLLYQGLQPLLHIK